MTALSSSRPSTVGGDSLTQTYLRQRERPIWSSGGTLARRPPLRHYIPKHPFYYTNNELYGDSEMMDEKPEENTKKFVEAHQPEVENRRAFSAPQNKTRGSSRKSTSSQRSNISRPKTSANNLRATTGTVNWMSTPIPGIRTIQEYDLYRRAALDHKNTNIYHMKSGLLPKFMGYVPGLKFRYGSTFGMLTYNAKEVGVERSSTWGGAVSLF